MLSRRTRKVIQRCMLMTTDPAIWFSIVNLRQRDYCVCGGAMGAEVDYDRRARRAAGFGPATAANGHVPLVPIEGRRRAPAGGFVYKRKQNKKGEEVGGIVPHVTLKSIANNEPPAEEVLVDRPEIDNAITRVTGPFCVEATIPTPMDWEGDEPQIDADRRRSEREGAVGIEDLRSSAVICGQYVERMLEVLRKSPLLRLEGNRTVTLSNVRPPARSLSLSAEAVVANGNGNGKKNDGAAPSPRPLYV